MYRADREAEYTRLIGIYRIHNVTATLRHNHYKIKINIDTDSGIFYANNGQARKLIFGQFRH